MHIKSFYFVRAPLGAGGRHLSNLLSLDNNISPILPSFKTKDTWLEFLFSEYQNNGKTAHFNGHYILSDPQWLVDLPLLDPHLSSVHYGHAASFDWMAHVIGQLLNKRYLSITFNSAESRSLLMQRELKIFGTETLKNSYYLEELCHFYNQQFTDPSACNDDVNLAVEVADLFVPNITSVLTKINQHFHLDIDSTLAQNLHQIWINKQI